MSDHTTIDWPEARRRFEDDDATMTSLAPLLGVTLQAVSLRARRHGWIKRSGVEAEARVLAIREFVARDAKRVLASLEEKHELGRRMLALVARELARLEDGELRYRENMAESMRLLASVTEIVERIDASVLRDGKWHDPAEGHDRPLPELPADFDFRTALRRDKRTPEDTVQ